MKASEWGGTREEEERKKEKGGKKPQIANLFCHQCRQDCFFVDVPGGHVHDCMQGKTNKLLTIEKRHGGRLGRLRAL